MINKFDLFNGVHESWKRLSTIISETMLILPGLRTFHRLRIERDAAITDRDSILKQWTSFIAESQNPSQVPAGEQPVAFQCNVCGTYNLVPMAHIGRECSSCRTCGSTVRCRAMMYLLSVALYGRAMTVPDFPLDHSITGIGLSDWPGYAELLTKQFKYQNTYLHTEPLLDIVSPPDHMSETVDFLISSDVFEHVSVPVSKAFQGVFALLKPGGHLILSVPSVPDANTIEHYPHLREFSVTEVGGQFCVVVKNEDGTCLLDANPVFHGGPGQVLEMRLFGDLDVVKELEDAGFTDIQVFSDPVPEFGLYFEAFGKPILARKAAI